MTEATETIQENETEEVSKPTKSRKNLSIGAKVYGLVAICLGVAGMIGGVSYWLFSLIGAELEAIAERDIPVTNALSEITAHQLEQEISMEHAFRYGELLKTDSHAAELFGKSKKKFEEYNAKINKELKAAEALIAKARDTSHTAKEKAAFQKVFDTTVKIDKAHHQYFEKTEAIFSLIQAGDLKKAHVEEEKIEKLVKNLNHEIEGLLQNFSGFTAQAALTAEAHEKAAIKMIAIISVIGIILGAAIAFWIVTQSVNRPLRTILEKVELLASGQYDIEIKVLTNNEIGRVFGTIQKLRDGLLKALELEKEQRALEKTEKEASDKEVKMREAAAKEAEERAHRMEEIISTFDSNVKIDLETVSPAATEMHASAEAMTGTAEQTSQRSSTVAAASEEATTNIQTVASAAEELSASVGEISRQVKESSAIADKAVQEAAATNEKVQGLAESAQKIGEVVNLINDIANQINLLALNATIEAARAGDVGKGFAVVASEVKSLATQTGKATEEIGAQIHEIQEATGDAVTAIGGISDIISQISEISGAVEAAVEEQGAASREIAGNVSQAAAGTQEISGNIMEVNQAASETGSNAAQVLSAADEPAKQGDALRDQVDQFLQDIRAA